MANTLHVFIICWTGMEENALHIAQSVAPVVERVTVVYSNKTNTVYKGAGDWVQVPDTWFWGGKFAECLRHYQGGVMVQVQADVTSDNWPLIMQRCRKAYEANQRIGVWAPNVDYTAFTNNKVQLGLLNKELAMVAQTDGIIWSASPLVIKRMQQLNYNENTYGWGIDWVAICCSYANSMLVLRDMTLLAGHPKSRGYDQKLAKQQELAFLRQMTLQEQAQYVLLNNYIYRHRRAQSAPA